MTAKPLRSFTWDDYGISRNRYKELQAFCLQYDEKKSKIKRGISAVNYDGMPKGSSRQDSLELNAIQNVTYQKDCEMIEQAAVKAAPEYYQYIIRSVTQGLSYPFIEYDEDLGRIPVSKTDFYSARRLFYHYLDLMKFGTN